jgi:hypothetical protein
MFLDALTPREVTALLGGARSVRISSHEVLQHEGEPAPRFWLLGTGRVAVYRLTRDGNKLFLRWGVPGDVFGLATIARAPARYLHVSSNVGTSANHSNADGFSFNAMAKRVNGTTLRTRTIEGISVQGIRYHTSKSTHECWFSPDLKTVVLQADEYPDRSFTENLTFRATSLHLATQRAMFTLEQSGKTNVR